MSETALQSLQRILAQQIEQETVPVTVLELICNVTVIEKPYPNDGRLYCNATFDDWLCFNYTLAGSSVYQPCPKYPGFNTEAFAVKRCMDNGHWSSHPEVPWKPWTDYRACSRLQEEKSVMIVHISGYALSILLCLIGLVIFNMFRQLKCNRVVVHQNLFISYILAGLVWIATYTTVPMNTSIREKNPVWCQVLHVITQNLTLCNYCWMVCEGFYLHTIIVITFIKERKLMWICFIFGWCFPLLPTAIYASLRAVDGLFNTQCWLYDSKYLWIIIGPVIFSLMINLFFLINILRILLSKLRAMNTIEQHQNRRTARAILILIPLLGLQYLIIPFRPSGGTQLYIFKMVSAFLVSYQGVLVALIFCFFNGEVISVVKRKWTIYVTSFDSGCSERHQGLTNTLTYNDVPVVKNGVKHPTGFLMKKNEMDGSEVELQSMVNGVKDVD